MLALIGMLAAAGDAGVDHMCPAPTSLWIVIGAPCLAAVIVGLLGWWSAKSVAKKAAAASTKNARIAGSSATNAAEIAAGGAKESARIAAKSAAENTVKLSLERFRKEQCWTAKHNAYSGLLQACHILVAVLSESEGVYKRAAVNPDSPETTDATAQLPNRFAEVDKSFVASVAGHSLFVSNELNAVMAKCVAALRPGDVPSELEPTAVFKAAEEQAIARQSAVMAAVQKIIILGRKDLDITWPDHSSGSPPIGQGESCSQD